jgi:hypothetical protein
LFLTIGCGSTVWNGGDLRPIPDEVLARRTQWARNTVQQIYGSPTPFVDEIALGAKAPLPKTFEKATALAHQILKSAIDSSDIDGLLVRAAKYLNAIYLAQLGERDVSPGEQDVTAVMSIAKPLRRTGRQGFGLSAQDRRAIEQRAMALAIKYLSDEGYECKDVSAHEAFDILANKCGVVIKVEVKGTTSDICDSILVTKNEVELHRKEKGSTALIIVSKINLDRNKTQPGASGGVIETHWLWDIDNWIAEPIAFQLSRQKI